MKEKRQILLTKKVNVGFRKTENHHQNNSAFFFRQVLPMDTKISRQKFEEKQHIWIVFKNLSQDNDQLQIRNSNFTMGKLYGKKLSTKMSWLITPVIRHISPCTLSHKMLRRAHHFCGIPIKTSKQTSISLLLPWWLREIQYERIFHKMTSTLKNISILKDIIRQVNPHTYGQLVYDKGGKNT